MNLTDKAMKRIERAKESQDREGACLICRKPFQTCPHNFGEIEALIRAYRAQKVIEAANR